MKLRLFGCAAAFALAGTLYAVGQDAPDTRMKGGADTGHSSGRSMDHDYSAPGRSDDAKGQSSERETRSERAAGPERAEKPSNREDKKAGNGQRNRNNGESDEKSAGASKNTNDKRDKSATTEKSDKSDKAAKSDKADKNDKADKTAKGDERNARDRAAESNKDGAKPSGGAKQEQATERSDKTGKRIELSADKRDRVQSSFRSDLKLKRETKVDVDVRIGSRASRGWSFAPVPVTVVEIVPEYRGYLVAYVEDEYVICEPDTYEIVAVLPASGSDNLASTGRGSGEAGMDGQCASSLTLAESDRTAILKEVEMTDEVEISDVTVGWSVPSDVKLKALPRSVVDRWDSLSGCRYFVVDDQIAIVDPDQHEVVLLIENDQR